MILVNLLLTTLVVKVANSDHWCVCVCYYHLTKLTSSAVMSTKQLYIIQLTMHWLLQLCSRWTLAPLQQIQSARLTRGVPHRFCATTSLVASQTQNHIQGCHDHVQHFPSLFSIVPRHILQRQWLSTTSSALDLNRIRHWSSHRLTVTQNSVCWHVVSVSGLDVLNSLLHTVRSLRLTDSHPTFQPAPALRPILLKVLLRAF